MAWEVERTDLEDVKVVRPPRHHDRRGWFQEALSPSTPTLGMGPLVQINRAFSKDPGTLRGVHFQRGDAAQGKLVAVLRGAIHDVAIDVRPRSPQFGQWTSVRLSQDDAAQLWIPPGYAHGLQTLEPDTLVEYIVTHQPYNPEAEGVIRWDDPELGIDWPLPPTLAERDAVAPTLAEARIT